MSRGYGERHTAWEVWREMHKHEGYTPSAYFHQCGSVGDLHHVDLGHVMCPGCRFELSHPENECTPLYRLDDAS